LGGYYFASAVLPELCLGEEADITFSQLMFLFESNLSPGDLRQTRMIQGLVDLDNLCAFWRKQPIDPRGALSLVELGEEAAAPEFAARFLEAYPSTEERLTHFGELIAEFFAEQIPLAKGFLRSYLEFERAWRLVMLGFRAKQLGRDVMVELQFEDSLDDLVGQILAQKDAPKFVAPPGWEELEELLELEPMELNHELERIRFSRVEAMCETEEFSIGFLLGYMVRLMIVERWNEYR